MVGGTLRNVAHANDLTRLQYAGGEEKKTFRKNIIYIYNIYILF